MPFYVYHMTNVKTRTLTVEDAFRSMTPAQRWWWRMSMIASDMWHACTRWW